MQAVEAVDPTEITDLKEEATGITTGGLTPLEEVVALIIIKQESCSLLL